MIFFAYLVAFGIYLLIAAVALFYVPTRFKERRNKLVAFLVAFTAVVLAPAAWMYYERSYFDRLCEQEAGVKIYRTAEGVEGFYLPDSGWGRAVKDYPYSFIESKKYDGKLYRYSPNQFGEVVETAIRTPSSHYAVREVRELLRAGVQRVEFIIVDGAKEEVLARKVEFNRGGDFLRPWRSAGSCPEPNERRLGEFLVSVLKPARIK